MKVLTKHRWPFSDVVEGNWDQKYYLSKNLPLYFKINDNHKLVSLIQREIKSDSQMKDSILNQHKKLEELKGVNIWLSLDVGIIKLSLFDVYESFLKHLRYNSFEDQLFNIQKVSLLGPTGPFTKMPLIECLNEELINKFVFSHILKNKLPSRKLRVYTKGITQALYGRDFSKSVNLEVKQITHTGILFTSNNDEFLARVSEGNFIKVFFNDEILKKYVNKENLEFDKKQNNIFEAQKEDNYFLIKEDKLLKSLSYSSGHTNEVYIFCRYAHFEGESVSKTCVDFIEEVDKYLDQFI